MEERSLLERLSAYAESGSYPFHMPGHKRNPQIDYIPAQIDITEIDGFDNLHHATGILKAAQERAAGLYGAEESFFLINGSSGGILAAISACCKRNGKLLMARNCHKAAYHGAYLRGLEVRYIYPELVGSYGICGGISAKDVEKALEEDRRCKTVFLTSPTYEGMVSDIREIADIVHRHDAILIVDEAHGAHFGIGGADFPKSAVEAGADIVIQSMHKTLPSMTQTAILHVCGERVDRKCLRRFLQIYQTSSPSYVFMAGMDQCVRLIEQSGREMFQAYAGRLKSFYEKVKHMRCLKVLQPDEMKGCADIYRMDASKICIFTDGCGITGAGLSEWLRREYQLELEMAAGNYAIAMTSVMDTEEGFERLTEALLQIDEDLRNKGERRDRICTNVEHFDWCMPHAVVSMKSSETDFCEEEYVTLSQGIGRISTEYRYVYPPGIPLIVPGEVITEPVVQVLHQYEACGLEVLGAEGKPECIGVVKETMRI